MQKIIVVAIRDSKSEVFSQPMFFATPGIAVRAFQDALADNQNNLSKHPDDYDLHHIGYFYDSDGKFENVTIPSILARGKEHKPQDNK